MKKLVLSILFISSSTLLPCSNIAIIGNNHAVAARTMDFPFNTGNVLGVGFVGDKNKTDLNLGGGKYQASGIQWKNKHAFIGQTWFAGTMVLDGVKQISKFNFRRREK